MKRGVRSGKCARCVRGLHKPGWGEDGDSTEDKRRWWQVPWCNPFSDRFWQSGKIGCASSRCPEASWLASGTYSAHPGLGARSGSCLFRMSCSLFRILFVQDPICSVSHLFGIPFVQDEPVLVEDLLCSESHLFRMSRSCFRIPFVQGHICSGSRLFKMSSSQLRNLFVQDKLLLVQDPVCSGSHLFI